MLNNAKCMLNVHESKFIITDTLYICEHYKCEIISPEPSTCVNSTLLVPTKPMNTVNYMCRTLPQLDLFAKTNEKGFNNAANVPPQHTFESIN